MQHRHWLFFLLGGCTLEGADIDTGEPVDPPDITGEYRVQPLAQVQGCETFPDVDGRWMEGILVISGAPDDLLFEFEGGEQLSGAVDTAFTWEAVGTVVTSEAILDVSAEGLVFIGDQTWVLDGDVVLDRADSTDSTAACTLTGRMEAEQNPP